MTGNHFNVESRVHRGNRSPFTEIHATVPLRKHMVFSNLSLPRVNHLWTRGQLQNKLLSELIVFGWGMTCHYFNSNYLLCLYHCVEIFSEIHLVYYGPGRVAARVIEWWLLQLVHGDRASQLSYLLSAASKRVLAEGLVLSIAACLLLVGKGVPSQHETALQLPFVFNWASQYMITALERPFALIIRCSS